MELAGKWYVPYEKLTDRICLWCLADTHLFNKGCSLERVKSDIAAIRADRCALFAGAGDYCDFIAPSDPRWNPATVSGNLPVRHLGRMGAIYTKAVLDLLAPIAHKCLGLGFGNHESRYMTEKNQQELHAGLCVEMAERAGHEVPDLGYQGMFDLVFVHAPDVPRPFIPTRKRIQGEQYALRIFVRHGEGAAQTPGGKLNSLVRKMREFHADVYLIGHCHEGQDQVLPEIGADSACRQQTQHVRYGIRTGSYLRGYSEGFPGYEEIKGYTPTCIGARGLDILPGGKRIKGFCF